ncbi:MAG: hypothetical protein IKM61_03745 [Eubacteriaceae bacterium]|nr:hypothetical protein [Eubacteriaceae bacterium]
MGKRGVKRKKQGKITPPLTKLDKAVYIALMALSALVYVLFLMLYIGVKDNYALKTPEIIAYIPRGEFTYLIFPLTLGFMIFIFWAVAYSFKTPIFGDRNIKYGMYEYRGIYPVFYKNKPAPTEKKNSSDRRFRKGMITFICAAILISALISSMGFFPRTEVYERYSLREVDMFNNTNKTYMLSDAKDISVVAKMRSEYRSRWFRRYPSFYMDVTMQDGEKYRFDLGAFVGKREGKIERMIGIKNLVPASSVNIIKEIPLERIEEYLNLSDKEKLLLGELFEE